MKEALKMYYVSGESTVEIIWKSRNSERNQNTGDGECMCVQITVE